MIRREIENIKISNMKERFAVQDIKKFIENDKNIYGKILVLYGLRRTGKTTMMEQVVKFYNKTKKCAFYEITTNDDMDSIKQCLLTEKLKGTEIICFDEITKAEDFIENSSILPDVFAKENMKIIVAGTDSLGFVFAEKTELFDRTERLHTTYIPYAEHSQVLNIYDVDDYISYGGLMHTGLSEHQIKDFETAQRYLDSAVAENISRSIIRDPHDNPLKELTFNEIRTIIEKLVELYSGNINSKTMQEQLKKTTLTKPFTDLNKYDDFEQIIDSIIKNEKNITKDFCSIINADSNIKTPITEDIVKTFRQYLAEMDLLSSIKLKEFRYTEAFGWEEMPDKREVYIIQPAIKFFHLQKGKEFYETEKYFNSLNADQKEYFKKKLDENIKGVMLEQIILFDTTKDLPTSRYYVSKVSFSKKGQNVGEYDMLIYDKVDNKHWLFEIKHSKEKTENQLKHLLNKELSDIMKEKYGNCAEKILLYRGKTCISKSNILYINISDFLILTKKYKDIKQVLNNIKQQPTPDVSDSEYITKKNKSKTQKKDDIGYSWS